MPDTFDDPKKNDSVIYKPTCKAPTNLMSKMRHNQVVTESRQCMKRGRPNRFQKIRILGNKRKVQRMIIKIQIRGY